MTEQERIQTSTKIIGRVVKSANQKIIIIPQRYDKEFLFNDNVLVEKLILNPSPIFDGGKTAKQRESKEVLSPHDHT